MNFCLLTPFSTGEGHLRLKKSSSMCQSHLDTLQILQVVATAAMCTILACMPLYYTTEENDRNSCPEFGQGNTITTPVWITVCLFRLITLIDEKGQRHHHPLKIETKSTNPCSPQTYQQEPNFDCLQRNLFQPIPAFISQRNLFQSIPGFNVRVRLSQRERE